MASNGSRVALVACNSADVYQQGTVSFEGVDPDGEQQCTIANLATERCLEVQSSADTGAPILAAPCTGNYAQQFFYDYESGEIANEFAAICVGVC